MALKQLVLDSLTNELNQDFPFNIEDAQYFNDSRLDVITYLIDQLEWSRVKKVEIITAIHLLQVASDALQLISNDKADWNSSLILQTDRLTSQAYILLSKHEEFVLIKWMALAEKEINILKIKVFQSGEPEPRHYIKKDETIKWTIIMNLVECYGLSHLKEDVETYLGIDIPNLSDDLMG